MKKIIVFLLCLTMGINLLFAQDIERNIKERLTDYFAKYTATAKISTPKLNSFDIDYDRRTIQIYASESFAYQPFLPETVDEGTPPRSGELFSDHHLCRWKAYRRLSSQLVQEQEKR